jgi:hypothetical protein
MRKRVAMVLGLAAIILMHSTHLYATAFQYTREATPETLTVGDVVEVRVVVTHSKDTQVTPDTVSLPEIFSLRGTQHTATVSGNSVIETWTYQIAVFEPGKHTIPESRLRQRLAEGNAVIHPMPAIMLSVVSLLPATASVVGTLKPLLEISLPRWLWLIAMGCLALCAWGLWARYRNRQIPLNGVATPALSPKEDAMAAIDTLATSGAIERGDYAMVYSRIPDILKRFLSRHYGQKMQEMTSSEVIKTLRNMGLDPWIHTDIQRLFSQSDYVKFAHADSSAQACYQLINTLKKSITAIAEPPEPASTQSGLQP